MAAEHNLSLSIDFGGSGSKVIYQFGGGKLQYMMLPPGLEEVSKEDFKRYKDLQVWRGEPKPNLTLGWNGRAVSTCWGISLLSLPPWIGLKSASTRMRCTRHWRLLV